MSNRMSSRSAAVAASSKRVDRESAFGSTLNALACQAAIRDDAGKIPCSFEAI